MMKPEVARHLVFCIDQNYLMPFTVVVSQLAKIGALPAGTTVFVVHPPGIENFDSQLRGIGLKHGLSITPLKAHGVRSDLLCFSDGDYVTEAAYYRMYLGQWLPLEVSTVLYLDADILVRGPLAELLNTELVAPIAAVDHFHPWDEFRFWGAAGGSYFNSGVLLIDVDEWRRSNRLENFHQILVQERHRVRWWDQDVLNLAFAGRWQRLEAWYNVTSRVLPVTSLDEIREKARVVHFEGKQKPWQHGNREFFAEWRKAYQEAFGVPIEIPQPVSATESRGQSLVRRVLRRLKAQFR